MEHVVIRKLEHLTGSSERPELGHAIETRDRPGPAFKTGSSPGEEVWVQLHGGLFVAKARIKLGWVGEFSGIDKLRARTRGSPIHDIDDFWKGRPRFGYAVVASLEGESWLEEPMWAGPRTYGYEWVTLEDDKKRASWLDPKEPPRGGGGLLNDFKAWMSRSGG
ncbi:MAG: hypothetical protein ACRDH9_11620 [Actinomycetota bacterium]